MVFGGFVGVSSLVSLALAHHQLVGHGTIQVRRPNILVGGGSTALQGIPVLTLPNYVTPPSVVVQKQEYTVSRKSFGRVVEKSPPTYFCKEPGFTLEGTVCVQTVSEPPRLVCPPGFDLNEHQCIRRASFLEACPPGYTKRNGACGKVITAAVIQSCPPGTEQAAQPGICEKQVPQPLVPSCPEGIYDARAQVCLTQSYVDAVPFCPEGFALVDGACVQETTYDCTDYTPSIALAQRQLAAAAAVTDCIAKCRAKAGSCTSQQISLCDGVAQTDVLTQSTKSIITVQKTCTKVTSTALAFSCAEGVLQGTQCCLKHELAPIGVCKALGDASNCYSRVRVPPALDCPPDFHKDCAPGRQCQCVALEGTALLHTCPAGFTECSTGNGCVRIAEVRPVCNPGYVLQGDICVRVIRHDAACVFTVSYECDTAIKGSCQ